MPIPAWLVALGTWLAKHFWQLLGIAFGISSLYFYWQAGSSIITGVQQVAPGIGAMVASVGMLFSLLPPLIMMMMMMWMMSTFMQLFG